MAKQKSGIALTVLLFSTLLLPLQALADKASSLRSLDTVRVLLDRAAMDYQMFKGENGNPRYSGALDGTINKIKQTGADIKSGDLPKGQQSNLAKMNDEIDHYASQLEYNAKRIADGGHENYSVVSQMYDHKDAAQALAQKIYKAAVAADAKSVPEVVQRCRNLAYNMQRMSTAYIEQSASGHTSRELGDKVTVDQLAKNFSGELDKLRVHSKNTPSINVMLAQVKSRWDFVEPSMLNYKDDPVPFLVYRYANSMVDDLLNIAKLYEQPNNMEMAPPSIGPTAGGSANGKKAAAGGKQ